MNWSTIKRFASRNKPGFTLQDVAREYVVTKKQMKPARRSKFGLKINMDPILIKQKVLDIR